MPRIRAWIPLSSALFVLSVVLGVTVTYSSLTTPRELRLDQGLQNLHEPWLTAVMQTVSTVFSPPAGLVILVVATALLWWRRRRFTAVSTFLIIAVGWNSTLILKLFVDRPRPPFVHDATASYPSGHVALATSCVYAAYFLVRRHPRRNLRETVAVVGIFTVVLVMASRMYLGDHYLTDTIGAVLVSSAAVVCLCGLWPTLSGKLERLPLLAAAHTAEHPPATDPKESVLASPSARPPRGVDPRTQTRPVPVPSHVGRHGSASRAGSAPLSVHEIAQRAGTSRHEQAARHVPSTQHLTPEPVVAGRTEPAPGEPVSAAPGEYRPPLGKWSRYDLD